MKDEATSRFHRLLTPCTDGGTLGVRGVSHYEPLHLGCFGRDSWADVTGMTTDGFSSAVACLSPLFPVSMVKRSGHFSKKESMT